MSILKVEPSAINTDASFVFGDIATTGNITVGDAVIQSTAGGGIEFVTATGTVNLDANTVSFLSNVSTQGLSGSNGYVGSQGVAGFTGSAGTNGFTGSAGQVQYQPGTAVPYILVKTNGSQQSVASGAEVLINLNTVSSGNVELSNGTDGFSIPRTGLYNIDVGYITNSSSHVNVTEIHARIFVNGTNRYSIFESIPAFGFNKSLSGATNLYLNQNDIVKIYFWAFNATLVVGASSTYATVTELLPPSAGFVGSSGTNGFTGSAAPLNLPVNTQTSAYTLTAADVGDLINTSSGGVTVPAGVFVRGDVVSIYNNSASNQTITQGASVTLRLVGTATTGNRTLAQRGLATLLCVNPDEFVISGGGLT
jgi:hypothetical protein